VTLYDYELQAWVVAGFIAGEHSYAGWRVWEARQLEGLEPLGCYHKLLEEYEERMSFLREKLGDEVWAQLEGEFLESLRHAGKAEL
jgi:predicted negative regulator of RcsB-dependent stress response